MIRLGKWAAATLAVACLLAVVAALVLTTFIDPNRYRHEVEAIVADLAGRPLVIEGDLKLTWFPWLGVRMGVAHLSNPAEVGGPPLIEWQSLAVAAKVLPLLRGRVVLDRIRLQSPHVRLRRDLQGHGNWEDLGPRRVTPPANSPGTAQRPPPDIGGIEIRDGELEYADAATGRHYSLSDWRLDLGEWRATNPFSVQTGFLAHEESLPAGGLRIQLAASALVVGLDPLFVHSPQLSVRIADAQVSGPVTLQQTNTGLISAKGSVTAHIASLRKLAADLGVANSLPRDPTALGRLELQTDWHYANAELVAQPLKMGIDATNFDGWITRSDAPQAAWRFELHADEIDLGRYLDIETKIKRRPFELPVPELRALNANGRVKFDRLQLADTQMTDVSLRFEAPEVRP